MIPQSTPPPRARSRSSEPSFPGPATCSWANMEPGTTTAVRSPRVDEEGWMMSIITISRGSYSRGKEVAEKVAQELGFECISREVLSEASEEFKVPGIQPLRTIHDASLMLDHLTLGKEGYVAYVQASLLRHFQRDNVVYHGLAGDCFIESVSHVLKVRIDAERVDRVESAAQREDLSHYKAWRLVEAIDKARRQWGLQIWGMDPNDPRLYDLLINIKKFSTDDAADIICRSARLKCFQATAESRQVIDNLLLAARVRAELVEDHPRADVTANEGVVRITLKGGSPSDEKEVTDIVEQIAGVEHIEINLQAFVTPD
jgi:cytidylate kinase